MIVHVARAAGWSVLCGGALYTFVSTHSWMLVALGAAGAINSGWWAWREFEAVLALRGAPTTKGELVREVWR